MMPPSQPEAVPLAPAVPTDNQPGKTATRRASLVGAAMAASAAMMWGANGPIARFLLHGAALLGLSADITPLTLVESRSLITVLGMGAFLIYSGRRRFLVPRRQWPLLLGFGLALTAVTYSYFLAVKLLPVAIAVMVQYTGPTIIALYTALATRRLPARRVWLALALTLLGVALLAGLGALASGGAASGVTLLGLLVAFGSAFLMAAYILLGERLGTRLQPQTSVFYGFLISSVIWLILQPPWQFQAAALTPRALPFVFSVGVFGTLLPFGLFLAAIRRLDATRAAIISTLEPVTAALLGWVWLGERLDVWQMVGGLLVLVGVIVVQLKFPTAAA